MSNEKIKQLKLRGWLKRNSIRANEEYLIKVLNNYDFKLDKDYKIVCNSNGDCDISLTFMGKSYRIEVDDENMAYNLLEENKALNPKHKNRYHLVRSFLGEEIIFDVIKFLKSNKLISRGVM